MTIAKIAAVAIAAVLTGLASQAHATVFTYDLTDTPHNSLLDGGFYQFTGGTPRYDSYSFERNGADVKLRYDDVSRTAKIIGTGYNVDTGKSAEFDLSYDEVTQTGNKISFGDTDVVGSIAGNTVTGKGFNLTLLNDTLKGDGWLTNSAGTHFGDFHFAGTKTPDGGGGGQVPVPAPLALIGAVALFGAWRRRRAIAA